MKHLFIVNPVAGGQDRTRQIHAMAEAAFRDREDSYEVYVTRGPLNATERIRSEAASGEQLHVYSCGGDGTFNECVCGAALLDNVAVAPFPYGTGNDFCRMFGEEAALYQDFDALLDATEHPIDLIRVNERYSVNICSVGIDARIGTDVHRYSKLPIVGGATGYVISSAVNMFKGINRYMEVRCGGFESQGSHALVCVCNGRYYGGGFNPCPEAMPDDGLLDIFVVKRVNLLTFAALIGKYAKGQADRLPKRLITHLRGTDLEIRFLEENVINVDGEAIYSDTVHMRLLPGALKLLVPRGMHFFD